MSFQLVLLGIIFLTPLLLLFLIKKQRETVEKKLPPGPPKLPLIGNLHQIGDLPYRSFQHLSNQYGKLLFLQLGSVPTLVVSSAELAREIFKTHDRIFSDRPALYVPKKLSYNCINLSFSPYGDYWTELRKIVVSEMLSPKRIQSYEAIRQEEVRLLIDECYTHSSNPVNLARLSFQLANDVLCRVAFGVKSQDNDKGNLHEVLGDIHKLMGAFNIADAFPWMAWFNKFNGQDAKLEKSFGGLDNFSKRIIEEHRHPNRPKVEHEDLVDVLLRIQKDPSQAITLSDDHIKSILVDMYFAGTDTSYSTLEWIMAELIKNPSVMRRVQDEVRAIAKEKRYVEEGDLSKLANLKLVIKETIRLHPPAPLLVPRETTESCTIQGYHIPAKTRVFVNVKSIATDPKYWENPTEFQPERFLNSSIDFRGKHFELLPFGAGRRGCPGSNFSMLLIELAVANLLHHFDWTPPPGVRAEDIDMEEAVSIIMHKKTPLCLVASPANV